MLNAMYVHVRINKNVSRLFQVSPLLNSAIEGKLICLAEIFRFLSRNYVRTRGAHKSHRVTSPMMATNALE